MPGRRLPGRPARPVGPVLTLTGADSLEQLEASALRDAAMNPTGPQQRVVDTSDSRYADVSTPCWLCGGPVTAADAAYPGASGWRSHREHAVHGDAAIAGVILAAVMGRRFDSRLTDADAALLLHDGRLPMPYERDAPSNLSPVVEPWSHVTRAQRRDLVRAVLDRLPDLRAVAAGTALTTCEDGPCGMCGTVAARAWVAFPGSPVWPGGGDVPFCVTCATAHHDTSMNDTTWDGYTVSTIRAATGVLVHSGEVPRFFVPPFARDHDRRDPAAGDPWAFLDADGLDELRLTLYLSRPPTSPEVPAAWRARVAAARAAAESRPPQDTAARALAVAQLAGVAGSRPMTSTPDPDRGWFS
ncbi:hypothetical protein Cch01nite_31790 [Cellulomonas chitinilytica]|uniref:Uncharacterized protein n=1 Tax=Cellulomonas chitinilytica TaxID=398759 RepID=A0A919P579_9CELL|nr:hypothetical protein [Cellulomonas chitinilytica]GIG22455.1 hypothetical protein Cch01nite_31790 [Cellulomonas chitinilytica]